MGTTTKTAEQLVMGDVIETEDGHGNPVRTKVYQFRRFSHDSGLLSTEYGDIRVKIDQRFTLAK